MPEGSVSKYDSEGSKTWSNTVQYEYDYTIDAPVREEIPFSLAPAPGSTLPILNALNLDVIPGTEVAGLSFKSNFWKIYKDGEAVYGNFSYKNAEFSTDTDGCKDGSIGKGENSLSIMSNSGTVIVK